jgi:predicted enzyme related to lactoylglutathione lyase
MGQPVVHFEVIGTDGEKLREYYGELFAWEFDANNPMKYGIVSADDNKSENGPSIGGGVGQGPDGYDGHITFYVEVPDVEASLAQAESLGGTRSMGPETLDAGMTIGMFTDPEGNIVGLIQSS